MTDQYSQILTKSAKDAEGSTLKSLNQTISNLDANIGATVAQGVSPDDLAVEEVILLNFVIDASGSMDDHRDYVVDAMQGIVRDLKAYKQRNAIVASAVEVRSTARFLFSYKKMEDIGDDEFSGYTTGGRTALFDGIGRALTASRTYAETLMQNDYRVRIVTIVISDGGDNESVQFNSGKLRDYVDALEKEELAVNGLVYLDSGFGEAADIADSIGFSNVKSFDVSKPDQVHAAMKDLTGFVSSSIIRQSQTTVATAQNSFFS